MDDRTLNALTVMLLAQVGSIDKAREAVATLRAMTADQQETLRAVADAALALGARLADVEARVAALEAR